LICFVFLLSLIAAVAWGAKKAQEPLLELGKGRLYGAIFSPDNSFLAVGSEIGIWLHDPETLQERGFIEGRGIGRRFDFSPDGSLIAFPERIDGKSKIRFWDLRQNRKVGALEVGEFPVGPISYSPDGEHIALVNDDDNTISIWNVKTKRLQLPPLAHQNPVCYIRFSPDGKLLASSGEEDVVRVWDVRNGNLVWKFKVKQRPQIGGRYYYAPHISFSPDGKLLAVGDWGQEITIWDVETGKRVHKWMASNFPIVFLIFSPDGNSIISSDGPMLKIWDAKTYKPVKIIDMDRSGRISFSPDGKRIAIVKDDVVMMADAETWEITGTIEGFIGWDSYLTISPDNKILASSRRAALLWDLETGKLMKRIGNNWERYPLSFTLDGKRLIGAGYGAVRVWNVETGEELDHRDVIHKGTAMSIWRLKLSPKGELLLLINSQHGIIKILSMGSLEEVGTWEYKTYDAAISPDGKLLAAGGIKPAFKRTIQIWDITTGKEVARLRKGPFQIEGIEFNLYGRLLASASEREVVVWDLKSEEVVTTLRSDFKGFIASSLSSSPDGDFLILERADGVLYVWKVMEDKVVARLRSEGGVGSVTFSPDRRLVAVSYGEGRVRVWNLPKLLGVDPKGKFSTRWGTIKNWLGQNFPNPANPETWIPFSISKDGRVIIEIYDLSGRLIRRLDLGNLDAGTYVSRGRAAYWDGRDERGERVASGIYFYSIKTPSYFDVRKLAIVR
jgi:WD40 repeat protein